MNRLRAVAECVTEKQSDALILTFLPDIKWLTGFSGSNALVIYTKSGLYFITDGRYTTQSQNEVNGAQIYIADGNLMQCAIDKGLFSEVERVVVQAEHVTIAKLSSYKEKLPGLSWIPVSQILEKAISVKSDDEKDKVLAAQSITDDVFSYLLGFLKPGITEQEVAAEIVYQHLRRGAAGMSFDPIVASGPNGALPHARPSNRKLQSGDLIVLDMGCFKDGYASDMTRTVAIGQPDDEALEVYQVVLDAQCKALEHASASLTSRQLDSTARTVIEEAGYGPYFSHSLGHGVGLQIHEWPSISWRADNKLLPGMIITIEPGIYLPGKFGVRIEDIIQLNQSGSENLTKSPKELISI